MRSCKLTLCCYRRAASTVPTRWPSLARGRAKTLARNDLTMTTILDSREARSTARSPRHSAPSSRTATAIPLRSGSKRFTCFCRASTRRPLRCLASSRTQRVLASARSLTTPGRRSSPILETASAAGTLTSTLVIHTTRQTMSPYACSHRSRPAGSLPRVPGAPQWHLL